MQNDQPELVALTEGEQDLLWTIYNTRRKNLSIAFIRYMLVFTGLSFFFVFLIGPYVNDILLGGKETWLVDKHFFSGWAIKLSIAVVFAVYFSVMSYISEILPFKKDAELGVKQKVPFTVGIKGYSSLTDQYFITPEGMTHAYEVDEETYSNAQEGCQIFMGRALHSQYIFSYGNSFAAMATY